MIDQILNLIIGIPLLVFAVVLVLLFLVAAWAPIESLSWWARREEESGEPEAVYRPQSLEELRELVRAAARDDRPTAGTLRHTRSNLPVKGTPLMAEWYHL